MDSTTTTSTGVTPIELIVILVLVGLLVVAPIVIIAISKVCCGVLNIWNDYRYSKRRRHPSISTVMSSVKSKGSSAYQEKMALVEGHSRLSREAGIRLEDYPFIADYAPAVLIPGLTDHRLTINSDQAETVIDDGASTSAPTTTDQSAATSPMHSPITDTGSSVNEHFMDGMYDF